MASSVTFQTRARTIDHLGREQIADCPTAISELWKNAYDAYAKRVELHLFDSDTKVAAIFDDGHGMNRQEFETKWLTVGTESKTNGFEIPEKDRNGLPPRPKQGQKGIGRLSSAALGPLLLLISKRKVIYFIFLYIYILCLKIHLMVKFQTSLEILVQYSCMIELLDVLLFIMNGVRNNLIWFMTI